MKKFVLLFVFVTISACGQNNFVQTQDMATFSWEFLSPASGAAVIKGSAVATNGAIIGVARSGTATTTETVTRVALTGIWLLPVTASSTVGNIQIGDFIFTTCAGIGTFSTALSNVPGILFGQALSAITASTTPGVYETIPVLLRQPSP